MSGTVPLLLLSLNVTLVLPSKYLHLPGDEIHRDGTVFLQPITAQNNVKTLKREYSKGVTELAALYGVWCVYCVRASLESAPSCHYDCFQGVIDSWARGFDNKIHVNEGMRTSRVDQGYATLVPHADLQGKGFCRGFLTEGLRGNLHALFFFSRCGWRGCCFILLLMNLDKIFR